MLSTRQKPVTFANKNKVSKILDFLHQNNFDTLMLCDRCPPVCKNVPLQAVHPVAQAGDVAISHLAPSWAPPRPGCHLSSAELGRRGPGAPSRRPGSSSSPLCPESVQAATRKHYKQEP